ncbi:MAG: metallophosphoesterase [Candidatus Methanomethylicia archaeon]
MKNLKEKTSTLLLTLIIILTLTKASFIELNVKAETLTYYAEKIKFPLHSLPEPVLNGGIFNVTIKMDSNVKWIKAEVYNETHRLNANLLKANYISEKGIWQLSFKLTNEYSEGVYNLDLIYEGGILSQPRCLWILPEWPEKLDILACGDVKPEGLPYFWEMMYEANLINPDLIIFLGDLVNVPTVTLQWIKFLEPYMMFKDPMYVTAGNHEYEDIGSAKLYENIIGPLNYSITIGKFLLVSLDTDKDGWVRMERLKWLENILKENKEKTKIIFFHFPLFTEKLKEWEIGYLNITSWTDIDYYIEKGYLFGDPSDYLSWKGHPNEAKELFRLIIEYDVRLILSEHIHSDLNVIVFNNSTGKKHYFITPAALAYDIPNYDIRGFKLIRIYSNGTIDENTLYNPGTGLFKYPNSIPIDSGTTTSYKPKTPYKLGYLEYYYTPSNNGSSHVVSIVISNELNITITNPRIIFQVPADIPITKYKWHPYQPQFKYMEKDGKYYIILTNITIPAKSRMYFTIESIEDKDTPQIKFVNIPQNIDKNKWVKITIEAFDSGWGVKEVEVEYKTSEGNWQKTSIIDLVKAENGRITYDVWIPPIPIDTIMTLKATVIDLSGKTAETTTNVIVGQPKPKYTLKILSSPIEGLTVTINGTTVTTPYTATLEEAKYIITIPQELTIAGKQYKFEKWSDGNTQTTRTIVLNQNQTLTIYYTSIEPTQIPSITYIAIPLVIIIIALVIIVKIRKT